MSDQSNSIVLRAYCQFNATANQKENATAPTRGKDRASCYGQYLLEEVAQQAANFSKTQQQHHQQQGDDAGGRVGAAGDPFKAAVTSVLDFCRHLPEHSATEIGPSLKNEGSGLKSLLTLAFTHSGGFFSFGSLIDVISVAAEAAASSSSNSPLGQLYTQRLVNSLIGIYFQYEKAMEVQHRGGAGEDNKERRGEQLHHQQAAEQDMCRWMHDFFTSSSSSSSSSLTSEHQSSSGASLADVISKHAVALTTFLDWVPLQWCAGSVSDTAPATGSKGSSGTLVELLHAEVQRMYSERLCTVLHWVGAIQRESGCGRKRFCIKMAGGGSEKSSSSSTPALLKWSSLAEQLLEAFFRAPIHIATTTTGASSGGPAVSPRPSTISTPVWSVLGVLSDLPPLAQHSTKLEKKISATTKPTTVATSQSKEEQVEEHAMSVLIHVALHRLDPEEDLLDGKGYPTGYGLQEELESSLLCALGRRWLAGALSPSPSLPPSSPASAEHDSRLAPLQRLVTRGLSRKSLHRGRVMSSESESINPGTTSAPFRVFTPLSATVWSSTLPPTPPALLLHSEDASDFGRFPQSGSNNNPPQPHPSVVAEFHRQNQAAFRQWSSSAANEAQRKKCSLSLALMTITIVFSFQTPASGGGNTTTKGPATIEAVVDGLQFLILGSLLQNDAFCNLSSSSTSTGGWSAEQIWTTVFGRGGSAAGTDLAILTLPVVSEVLAQLANCAILTRTQSRGDFLPSSSSSSSSSSPVVAHHTLSDLRNKGSALASILQRGTTVVSSGATVITGAGGGLALTKAMLIKVEAKLIAFFKKKGGGDNSSGATKGQTLDELKAVAVSIIKSSSTSGSNESQQLETGAQRLLEKGLSSLVSREYLSLTIEGGGREVYRYLP